MILRKCRVVKGLRYGSADQSGNCTSLLRRRVAARISGLASGLALAVRPAGAAEVSGVNGAPKARPRGARMRSTVEAGGADPENARGSAPVAMTFPASARLA